MGLDPSDPQNSAVIVITIQGGVKNLLTSPATDHCTDATFDIPRLGAANAQYNGTGRADGHFYVHDEGYLDFVFRDASIRPIGIAFKYDGSSPGLGPRGDVNMPFEKMSFINFASDPYTTGAGIRVYDKHADKNHNNPNPNDPPIKVRWGYYIFFQDSLGTIGMIDPDMENDVQS
jgi:hypothetical protein